MQISESLNAYEKRTLLAVCDNEHATFFLLHEREAIPVGELSLNYPSKENMDRTSGMTPGGAHFSDQSENLEDEGERRFGRLLANELHDRLQKDEYEDLILTLPEPRIHEFVDVLPNDVRPRLVKTLPKNLINQPLPDIIEHLQKTA